MSNFVLRENLRAANVLIREQRERIAELERERDKMTGDMNPSAFCYVCGKYVDIPEINTAEGLRQGLCDFNLKLPCGHGTYVISFEKKE